MSADDRPPLPDPPEGSVLFSEELLSPPALAPWAPLSAPLPELGPGTHANLGDRPPDPVAGSLASRLEALLVEEAVSQAAPERATPMTAARRPAAAVPSPPVQLGPSAPRSRPEAPPVRLGPSAPRSRPEAPALEFADWGSRVAAAVIDAAVIAFAAFVIIIIAEIFGLRQSHGSGRSFATVIVVIAIVGVWALYFPLWLVRTDGQTWGKKRMGIRVVRANRKPIDTNFALYREVVIKGVVATIAATLTAGLSLVADSLWPLVDKRKRALHDHVAESFVVRDKAPSPSGL